MRRFGSIGNDRAQYIVEDGKSLKKAIELAAMIAKNTPITNMAVTHILPRILDAGQDIGLMLESLTAAISKSTPKAKERLRAFWGEMQKR